MISQHAWGRDRGGAGSTRGEVFFTSEEPKDNCAGGMEQTCRLGEVSLPVDSIDPTGCAAAVPGEPLHQGGVEALRPPPSSPLENPSSTPDTPPAPPSRHIDPAPGQGSPADLNVVTQAFKKLTN